MTELSQFARDWAEILAWLVASVGGVVAAFRAVVEMRRARIQRDEDLRWRQAREAKQLLDEMEADPLARNAMLMLDWDGRNYQIAPEQEVYIDSQTMLAALRTRPLDPGQPRLSFTQTELFVRDCFDHFFDQLEDLEHFVNIRLVRFEDLADDIGYHVALLRRSPEVYREFMRVYHYDQALRFLERYPEWRAVSSGGE